MCSACPKVLLIGGHGGLSGVPTHLRHLSAALQDVAKITVMHDEDQGGYAWVRQGIVQKGLATSLRPAAIWSAWRALRRACLGGRYDIVWAHARLPVLLFRLGVRRSKSRMVLTYHGLPFEPGQRRWAAWVGIWLEAILLRLAPSMTLVVLSQGAEARLREILPKSVSKHRISSLPNSSDLRVMAPDPRPPERFHIVMTGRASWQKNLPAAQRILSYLPQTAQLTLCGHGTDTPALNQDRMVGLGPVADVRPLLAGADMYLLTSRYEGLPIGALEAFQAGVPVAMPRGTCDLLDQHPFAVEIDPEDPAGAAQLIHELWQRWAKDTVRARAQTQGAWEKHYGFEPWKTRAQSLFKTV